MTCTICNHPQREEIERACLLRDFGDTEVTLRDIAKEFKVDLKELQVHVLMHIPLDSANANIVNAVGDEEQPDSIAKRLRLREADILRQVMEDSYVTFKNISSKINSIVALHTSDKPTLGQITKPVADLYLGTSQSIRDTAEKLVRLDVMEHGEKDSGLSALTNLVNAIHSSPMPPSNSFGAGDDE